MDALIAGLRYVPDFLAPEEERELQTHIDAGLWLGDLERRVQHFGYRYNYRTRSIDESMRVGELPDWMRAIGQRLVDSGLFSEMPDQGIVNEYEPGQGIAPHIDCQPCFGEFIASITLGSGCLMDFKKKATSETLSLWLAPRSLVFLSGEARYEWLHGIQKRKSDVVDGEAIARGKRVSLTLRNVIRS